MTLDPIPYGGFGQGSSWNTFGGFMQWKMATGADFDRINDMTAHSRLSDLVGYASGLYSHDSSGAKVPQCATDRSIQSASHFIMEIW